MTLTDLTPRRREVALLVGLALIAAVACGSRAVEPRPIKPYPCPILSIVTVQYGGRLETVGIVYGQPQGCIVGWKDTTP